MGDSGDSTRPSLAGQYLTFYLGEEIYGLPILKIQEIIELPAITPVPRTPDYIRGVINLRGDVVPVVILRTKFGMEEKEDTERTCIIVLQLDFGDQKSITGIIVDEVWEVVNISEDQIDPPPSFGSSVPTEFIVGMAKLDGGKVAILLDGDKIISKENMSDVIHATS